MKRRDFLKVSAGTALLPGMRFPELPGTAAPQSAAGGLPDLSPARWIWYPSERCLQNTFILLRRDVTLAGRPRRATGWIAADSRYLLELNARRVQWGPAPADQRWPEADPDQLTEMLQPGPTEIGATLLF